MNSRSEVKINPQRLWDSIQFTAQFGATKKDGICRLALSESDRQGRDWLSAQVSELGCSLSVDEMGNMFAYRAGESKTLPPIAMGSHFDSQPTGGKFDGVLGVLAGLEVLRAMHDAQYTTYAPLALVNWTNEEGARFAPAMLGSGAHAGVFDRAFFMSRESADGTTVESALDQIGYRGAAKVGTTKLGAMFELHIEQGPILESQNKLIGIVTGVQSIGWYDITFTGNNAHAGSTPLPLRKDALLAAAHLISSVRSMAQSFSPNGLGTVGFVEVFPNSRNVVPGTVKIVVDLRNHEDDGLAEMDRALKQCTADCASASGVSFDIQRTWHSPAVKFAPDCIDAIRSATEMHGFPSLDMVSGAGHDSVYISRLVPTAMIFVPSAGGISHSEDESTSFEECAAGAQVLLSAVMNYDRRLSVK